MLVAERLNSTIYSSLSDLFKDNPAADIGYDQYKVVLMSFGLTPIGLVSLSVTDFPNNPNYGPSTYNIYLCHDKLGKEVFVPINLIAELIKFIVTEKLGDVLNAPDDKKLPKYEKLLTLMKLSKEKKNAN